MLHCHGEESNDPVKDVDLLLTVSYTFNYLQLECMFLHLALKDEGVLDYYLSHRYLHLFDLDDIGVSSKDVNVFAIGVFCINVTHCTDKKDL